MFKVNYSITILFFALLLAGAGAFYSFKVFSNSYSDGRAGRGSVQAVFLETDEYKATFGEAVKSAKSFYDLYGRALVEIKENNYDVAIKLLNESLPHVEFGPEKAMVYYELARIYREQGKPEMELRYAELVPKYTANPDVGREFEERAAKLRARLLRPKPTPSNP